MLAGAVVGFVGSGLWLLALARVLIAVGGAALVPSAVALLRNELPEDRRGRAFGMFGALMTLAAALGPLIGGELVRLLDWRSVFVANVVEFGLFRSTAFTAGTLLIALQNFVMYALLFEVPIVLHELLGLDAAYAGRILVTMMIAVVVAAVVAGRLTDLLGARVVGMIGSLLAVAGLALLYAQDLDRADDLTVPLAVLGIGLGAATPAAQAAAQSAAPRKQSGMAAGVMSTMRYLGGLAGVAVLGAMLSEGGGNGDAIIADHRAVLLVFSVALVASAVCAAALPGRVASVPGGDTPTVAPTTR